MSPFKKTDLLWLLSIAAGVVLRLWQYFINRSFSADESSLAFNLATRSFSGLTQPLDYQQGAPIGFLFIEKTALLVMGNNEYALRFFPLLCGILAMLLLYIIAKKHFNASGLFAVFAFSIGWNLVYFSSELKQYSSDVFIALLLIYLASRCVDETIRAGDFLLLGVCGALAIWISHPSFFILAGIGLLLLIEKRARKEHGFLKVKQFFNANAANDAREREFFFFAQIRSIRAFRVEGFQTLRKP